MVWFYLVKNSLLPRSCGATKCSKQDKAETIRKINEFLKMFVSDNINLNNHLDIIQAYLQTYELCSLFVSNDNIGIGSRNPNGQTFNEGTIPIKLSNIHGDLLPTMCTPGKPKSIMKLCLKDLNIKVRFLVGETFIHNPLDLYLQLQKGHSITSGNCDTSNTFTVVIGPEAQTWNPKGASHLHTLYLKYAKL